MTTKLTLGPNLFNWAPNRLRDFYYQIADEAPIDTVYIGEVVCSKRTPFFLPFIEDVTQRLQQAGKEVVLSTQALLVSDREVDDLRAMLAKNAALLVEANDLAGVALLAGKPHCLGPYINIYNESALAYHAKQGAVRITLPPELPKDSIKALAATHVMEIEVQVFGRLPLAISARCAHARSYGLHKHNCQYVCQNEPDGLDVFTLDNEPFLAVNGLQTLSYTYCNLINEVTTLQEMGVQRLRLSPHDTHMVQIAKAFRGVLDRTTDVEQAQETLDTLLPHVTFSNGYFHDQPGCLSARIASTV